MTPYRASPRVALPDPAPQLPSSMRLRARSTAGLATLVALGCGVVGWLGVTPLCRDIFSNTFERHMPYEPPDTSAGLSHALPALFSTALIAFLFVRRLLRMRSVGRPTEVLSTIFGGMVAGVLNGFVYFGLRGLTTTPMELGVVFPAGVMATFVSAPLGLVFGLVLFPFVWAARRELEKTTHRTPSRLGAVAAIFLVLTAIVAVVLGDAYTITQRVVVPASVGLLVVGVLSALVALRSSLRIDRMLFALVEGTHPSLVVVPLPDASVPTDAAPLAGGSGEGTVAVVSRLEHEVPLRSEKPETLALLSGCYRAPAMPLEAERVP